MKKIFITGATGNVGVELLKALQNMPNKLEIIVGVREEDALSLKEIEKLAPFSVSKRKFDFIEEHTYQHALKNIDILFLLRPPQITEMNNVFKPLIKAAQQMRVKHIVFLSVQGVEKSSIIPHHKIETLIVESGIKYTFLRPAYFMQNFTTTLHNDLHTKKLIFLPAGEAKFTLVDVSDIGKVAANIIVKVANGDANYDNTYFELTSNERLNFREMAEKLSSGLDEKITYDSPNLVRFWWQKRKEDVAFGYILVLIMLHYLQRFQTIPKLTNCVEEITGKPPKTFDEFVFENKDKLL
jgi:uncharacterized protein YbjT (DUF2867 family)